MPLTGIGYRWLLAQQGGRYTSSNTIGTSRHTCSFAAGGPGGVIEARRSFRLQPAKKPGLQQDEWCNYREAGEASQCPISDDAERNPE
jgi:hypothetical protein